MPEFFRIEGMSTMKVVDTFSKQLKKFAGKKTSGATKPKDPCSLLWASFSHEFLLEVWRRLWMILLIVVKALLTQLSLREAVPVDNYIAVIYYRNGFSKSHQRSCCFYPSVGL